MRGIITALLWLTLTSVVLADPSVGLTVNSVLKGKIFYIAGKQFRAIDTCSNIRKGDVVVFQGDPNNCYEIAIYDRNTASYCAVHCNQGS
jgi:hypothetical protein